MSKMTSLKTRQKIKQLSEQGVKSKDIALELNLSIWTVRKWRQRLKKKYPIYSSMGRPPTGGSLSSFAQGIREHIEYLRGQRRGWGAKVLHFELKKDPRFSGTKIPSIRAIGLFLKQKGLIKTYEKHIPMPDSQVEATSKPHQLWQMDAQGNTKLENIGPIAMINIKDVCSRSYCMAFPNKKKSAYGHSKGSDYQCALRMAFIENGLPEKIQTDHEAVFYENKGKSPFPTILHLWLIGLGIGQVFSRFHQPTDQAKVERMHQTIEKQTLEGIVHQNWESLFNLCQQRRKFLNETFPCSTLGNKPPYQAFPQARHSGRYYHPQLEPDMIDLNRIYAFLEKGKWFRAVSKLGSVSIGGQVYYLSGIKGKAQVQVLFNAKSLMLSFYDVKERLLHKIPIKGINKKALMGEVFWKMSNIQLELPLFWETQKVSTTFLHST